MNINKEVIERTFDLVGDSLVPISPQEGEVTAKMMHEEHPELTHRQWLNRLKKGVAEGKLIMRTGKGGEKIFRPNE